MENEFDNRINCRLFRSVREILHPTISKKNISDYTVVLDEELLPIRVFYPKKMSGVDRVIIYIHGNTKIGNENIKYSHICHNLVELSNSIVVAVEYREEKELKKYKNMIKDINEIVQYLYRELQRCMISKDNIYLMGDSTAGLIISALTDLNKKEPYIEKQILFYPVLNITTDNTNLHKSIKKIYKFISESYNEKLTKSIEYYPSTLIIVGNSDPLKENINTIINNNNNIKCVQVPFSTHSFLNNIDEELLEEIKIELTNYMNK